MGTNTKTPVTEDMLHDAANLFRLRLIDPSEVKSNRHGFIGDPNAKLPIDEYLEELFSRTKVPKLVSSVSDTAEKNQQLIEIYKGIEWAFNEAGMLMGGNVAGYRERLKSELKMIRSIQTAIDQFMPERVPFRLNSYFREGYLENRRPQRISGLYELRDNLELVQQSSNNVATFLEDDLELLTHPTGGRPPDIQKLFFLTNMARLWTKITGEKPAKKPTSMFGKFVVATWKSGFPDHNVDSSFERQMRFANGVTKQAVK